MYSLVCNKCGGVFISAYEVPKKCGICGTEAWNKPLYEHTCKKCKRVWSSTIELPSSCPSCNSYTWDEEPRERRYTTYD